MPAHRSHRRRLQHRGRREIKTVRAIEPVYYVGGPLHVPSAAAPLEYHVLDPCRGASGHLGGLTTSQEAALSELRGSFEASGIDKTLLLGDGSRCPPERLELCLLRFLRSSGWKADAALDMLRSNANWRTETNVPQLLLQRPKDILGQDEEMVETLFRLHYPHWHIGYDLRSRPVLLQRYSGFNTEKLRKILPLERLVRYHCWEQEMNSELLRGRDTNVGCIVETYLVILDFEGMSVGQFNRDFLWLLQSLSDIDRLYYPGRGGDTFLVNTPPVFNVIWAGIRGFMERTQAKMHVFGRGDDWRSALRRHIAPEQLPPEYGGCGRPLAEIPFLGAVHAEAISRNRRRPPAPEEEEDAPLPLPPTTALAAPAVITAAAVPVGSGKGGGPGIEGSTGGCSWARAEPASAAELLASDRHSNSSAAAAAAAAVAASRRSAVGTVAVLPIETLGAAAQLAAAALNGVGSGLGVDVEAAVEAAVAAAAATAGGAAAAAAWALTSPFRLMRAALPGGLLRSGANTSSSGGSRRENNGGGGSGNEAGQEDLAADAAIRAAEARRRDRLPEWSLVLRDVTD